MPNDEPRKPVQLDPDLEREIRDGRKFSLSEAIGRMAGPGMMKGVSPATRLQQAEAELEKFLPQSSELSAVLLRQVKHSDDLLNNLDAPLAVLASTIQRTLASEYLLSELTRAADVEWGRTYGERPYFERAGAPAHGDDPYTIASVRAALTRMLQQLSPTGE